jgi:hypothetical protein
VVVDDLRFQGRRRSAAGDDGGFGSRWRARKAAAKGEVRVSFGAPERGEKVRRVEREGES